MPLRNTVNEYLDYATVHGFGRFKNTPYTVLKVIWVLCLCASLAMIIFQFVLLMQKYQSHPISTTIELKTPSQVAFPAVTLCNTNPVKYESLHSVPELWDIVNNASEKYQINIDLFNETDEYGSATFSNEPIDYDILWSTADRFRMAFNSIKTDSLQNMSQTLEEFVMLCTYIGYPCATAPFEMVSTYEYGICFNIFPELMDVEQQSKMVSAAGKRYGFELLLYTGEAESIPFVTFSSGVYVMVHDQAPGTKHMYLTDGVVVPSGFEAEIKVSKVEKTRVKGKGEEPRCSDTVNSYSDCIHGCQQMDVATNCDCRLSSFDLSSADAETNSFLSQYRHCSTAIDYTCIQETLLEYANTVPELCSDCRMPCYEAYYEMSTAMTPWPSENFVPILRRILTSVKGNEFTTVDGEFVKKNFVLVRLYLSSLSYQSLKEEDAYSPVNFVSDLGGTLGLWAGFSVLSLLEIFELIVLLCARWKREGTRVDDNPEENTVN